MILTLGRIGAAAPGAVFAAGDRVVAVRPGRRAGNPLAAKACVKAGRLRRRRLLYIR